MSGPNTQYDPVEVAALDPAERRARPSRRPPGDRRGGDARRAQGRAARAPGREEPARAGQPRDRRAAAERQGRGRQARRARPAAGSARRSRPGRPSWRPSATRRILVEEAVDLTVPVPRRPLGARHPLSLVSERVEDIFVGMGWEIAEGPEVESEWLNFDALNIGADHPARADAGHLLRRAGRLRPGAAHAHLPGAGPHHARPRAADLRPLPGQGVPHRRPRRHAHPGLPPVRGARRRQGHHHGPPPGTLDALRAAAVRRGHRDAAAPQLLPVHRAERRDRLPCWICGGSADPSRAAPAAAPAGSSSAAPAWSTSACCAPPASTPTSTPGSRSASASSARSCCATASADMHDIVEGDVRFSRAVRDGDLMHAPVSWLRELADVARGRHRCRRRCRPRARRPRGGGRCHGGDIAGPLVVGRVLSVEPEPQKNGKTINWCTVDVGAHGQRVTEGKPQEIVCGAHNFGVGDLVVVRPARRGAARRLRDLRAQDLRPRLQRDDLLARRARPRRRPRRHHRAVRAARRGRRGRSAAR